jgi:hypothetical protein
MFVKQIAGDHTAKLRRLIGSALLILSVVALPFVARAAAPAEIWWAPQTGISLLPNVAPLGTDFPNLFTPGSPWTDARSHMHAIVFGDAPFTRLGYPADELARIVAGMQTLQARGTQLSFLITAVPVDHPVHREGLMIDTHALEGRLKQLQRLGIRLDSVMLDTPLVNGSINHIKYQGVDQNPGYPVDETARRVARTMSMVRGIFPNVAVYDAEGPTHQPLPIWKQTLTTWLAAYRTATGRKLDGMVLDMDWKPDWETVIRDTCAILHQGGTRCGTILDYSAFKGMTDAQWNAGVLGLAHQISADGGLGLDFVLFASWSGHPVANLPESDPTTYTGMVHDYIRDDIGSR